MRPTAVQESGISMSPGRFPIASPELLDEYHQRELACPLESVG
jgi:hypothetical protein